MFAYSIIQQVCGSTELFYSFEEKNPKSGEDYVRDEDRPGEKDENFGGDKVLKRRARRTRRMEMFGQMDGQFTEDNDEEMPVDVAVSKYYLIQNPNASVTLYFSLIGKEEENQVQVIFGFFWQSEVSVLFSCRFIMS